MPVSDHITHGRSHQEKFVVQSEHVRIYVDLKYKKHVQNLFKNFL